MHILLDKKGLCNVYSSVYPDCSSVYKKKSDYRGNFIIGVSKNLRLTVYIVLNINLQFIEGILIGSEMFSEKSSV